MDATLYVVGRQLFLNNFKWAGASDIYFCMISGPYTFSENDAKLSDVTFQAAYSSVQPMTGLVVSPKGWASSSPVNFPTMNWPSPAIGAVIAQFTGTDVSDMSQYGLIAYLPEYTGQGFYPGGTSFIAQYAAAGAEGWFRP